MQTKLLLLIKFIDKKKWKFFKQKLNHIFWNNSFDLFKSTPFQPPHLATKSETTVQMLQNKMLYSMDV